MLFRDQVTPYIYHIETFNIARGKKMGASVIKMNAFIQFLASFELYMT